MNRAIGLALGVAAVAWGAGDAGAAEVVRFERDVVPIFARRCVSCHHAGNPKGGLSLATKSAALRGGESGPAISPSRPDASFLLDYVAGDEPEMPKEGEPLSAAEVETLRRWIAAGADWPDDAEIRPAETWWSLRPLRHPPTPDVSAENRGRLRTPIDAFVLARLEAAGLSLASPADARTIVRRLYYDLLGLPPSTREQADWVARLSAERAVERERAYEELVDALLASPHYGERWGRHWLDVVKYADTHGYDKDKLRPHAWPYRDYVIRSFNEDKPYRRFIEEQIAGDALYPGAADGVLGLGMLAAGPWDFIGHVEVPESKLDGRVARHLDRDEMVSNVINSFCSATIHCARCHDHKFDPYTQSHYYGLQAVFAAVDRADRVYGVNPEVARKRQELVQQRDRLRQALGDWDAETRRMGGEELEKLQARVAKLRASARPVKKPPEHGYHSGIEPRAKQVKWVQFDLGEPRTFSRLSIHPCYDEYAGIGAGFGFPIRFQVATSNDPRFAESTVAADFSDADFPPPGLRAVEVLLKTTARYVRITAIKLAPRRNDYIFALAEVELFDAEGKNVASDAKVSAADSIEAPPRWRRQNLIDGKWPRAAAPDQAAALAKAEIELARLLTRFETPERLGQRAALQHDLRETDDALSQLPAGRLVYAAATDFPPQSNFRPTLGRPRSVHVLHRGHVQQPGEEALPGALPLPGRPRARFELPPQHSEADRRAALARWLTDAENPLTWRSIANRVWQGHFGQGIVTTPNDFGRMGQPPSHPQLLDWLAAELRRTQSIKRLHRIILLSSVYRQASREHPRGLRVDAANRWLWRAPRRRLSAEEIRDTVLLIAGRLDRRQGGPGFYRFVLEKTAHSPHYQYHKFDPADPSANRRSVYRFIVRSQPDPWMTTLDCADSSKSTPRREETTTALQALALLNNRFQLTMAEAFAERLERDVPRAHERPAAALRIALGREPTTAEEAALKAYAQRHGLKNLCRIVLNLNELVYVD